MNPCRGPNLRRILFIVGILLSVQGGIVATEPTILRGPETRVFDLAYSSDGALLAAAYEDGSFRIWDVATRKAIVSQIAAHASHCRSIAWGTDSQTVWTTGDEGTIKSWSSKTGEASGIVIPIEKPYRVLVCPTPERLVVASRDAAIYLFPVGNEQHDRKVLSGHQGPVRDLALSKDGKLLASVGHDHTLKIWDLNSKACLQSSPSFRDGRLFAVAFAPRG